MEVKEASPGTPSSSSALGEAKQKTGQPAQSGSRPTAELELGAPSNRTPSDDVPPGYKRTEVGVIPEDWHTAALGAVTECLDNLRVPLNESQRSCRVGSIPYCGANGVLGFIDDFVVDDDIILIAEDGGHFDEHATRPIAYRMRGKCWVNNHAHIIKAKSNLSQNFIFYSIVHKDILSYLASGTRAKLNRTEMDKIEIPLPPTKAEQRAIATALSDADALIAALQRLIAKKRAIKQGTMQALLTGRQRLPGFTGEWETKLLGDVSHIKTGSRNNQDNVSAGAYPFFVRSEHVERINSYAYDCEAILVPGEGKIGEIFHYISGRFDVHQRVYAITQFVTDACGKFIYFYMKQHFGYHALQNTVKATVDSLRLPTFQNFEMHVPPTRDEQTAIATVLADMDAEIEALEARLAKTRALKAGMMQQLLTGRVRLPLEEAA